MKTSENHHLDATEVTGPPHGVQQRNKGHSPYLRVRGHSPYFRIGGHSPYFRVRGHSPYFRIGMVNKCVEWYGFVSCHVVHGEEFG